LLFIKGKGRAEGARGRRRTVEKWTALVATIPASAVFAWIIVRFMAWRRTFVATLSRQAVENG
jgi:hypothetical protein